MATPRPVRFSHVVLQTQDLQSMRNWYSTAFPLEFLVDTERALIATYDDEHHRFAFTKAREELGVQASSLRHTAFAMQSLSDLIQHYETMKAAGILPVECVNHGPTLSYYYEDPDGNGVEFFVDRFLSMDEAKAFMRSDTFQRNFFGYFVDPEEIQDRFYAGESADQVMSYDVVAADAHASARAMDQGAPGSEGP